MDKTPTTKPAPAEAVAVDYDNLDVAELGSEDPSGRQPDRARTGGSARRAAAPGGAAAPSRARPVPPPASRPG